MKAQIIFVMFFAMFVSFSCEKSSMTTQQLADNQGVIVRTGTSFGFCVGECIRELEINSLQTTFKVQKRDIRGSSTELVLVRTCQDKITSDESNKLLRLANLEAFKKNPTIIGCPDCADGGAEWIEIEKSGEKYRVTFEYGQDVKEFTDLLKFVRDKRVALDKSCQ